MDAIVNIVFWILLGLWFLGVNVPYQEVILGLIALLIGLLALISLLRRP